MRNSDDSLQSDSSTNSDSASVQLIVGLGNPGTKYANTRHNIGERWAREFADEHSIDLRHQSKFQGFLGRGSVMNHDLRVLVPTSFMNRSGQSVGSTIRYFRIPIERVLVAYDEVAFPVGTCRLKIGGGHNGHNGVRSVIEALGGSQEFVRLRIGVGRPNNPSQMVDFLTGMEMPADERVHAESSSAMNTELLRSVLDGDWQRAMWLLHSEEPE